MNNRRDFREETKLNAAEFALLREVAGQLGLSKSAALRYCLEAFMDERDPLAESRMIFLHSVGKNFMRKRRAADTDDES